MNDWTFVEPDLESIFARCARPLDDLAAGAIPAIVLRGAFPEADCQTLVDRLIAEELLFDPRQPVPPKFRDEGIPEGFYREGRDNEATYAWKTKTATGRTRIDIGSSLGYRGSDKDAFLAHAAESNALFDRLFADANNPIHALYHYLEKLSIDKRAVTAREPDGRQYGSAIIRAHYGGYTYQPHFDSVRIRERRTDYSVYDFDHQFAGVLVLQNTHLGDQSAQCVLHRCLWQPEIDPHIKQGTFHDYARDSNIENVEVVLQPGDLYFFNTRSIHEVPGVAGDLPRIVLATFIGYSTSRDEIFVWS
jgi:hypothetical protein